MTLEQLFDGVGNLLTMIWACLAAVQFTFDTVTIHPLYIIVGFMVLMLVWVVIGKLTDNIIMKGDN